MEWTYNILIQIITKKLLDILKLLTFYVRTLTGVLTYLFSSTKWSLLESLYMYTIIYYYYFSVYTILDSDYSIYYLSLSNWITFSSEVWLLVQYN